MNAEGALVTALTSGIDCAAPAHNLELASKKAANVINLLRLRDVLEALTDFSNIKSSPKDGKETAVLRNQLDPADKKYDLVNHEAPIQ
jgi:hypothetical protein